MTYHPARKWSTPQDGRTPLQSAMIGQEFVLDGADYPEVESWVDDLVRHHAAR